jgi:putative sigma-54 modulation protein
LRTIIKGKNYEVPDRDREYAQRKLGRLERLLDDRTDATVELSVEQHRSAQDSHIVDVTLVINGQTLRSSAAAPTHQAGIDAVADRIERRAVSFRETNRVRKSSQTVRGAGAEPEIDASRGRRDKGGRTAAGDGGPGGDEAGSGDDGRRVVKVKRFAIEPMFEEDAVARMEELGHAFFVFVNAENERVSILYRRSEGDFGLIEPVVGGGYTKGGPIRRPGAR